MIVLSVLRSLHLTRLSSVRILSRKDCCRSRSLLTFAWPMSYEEEQRSKVTASFSAYYYCIAWDLGHHGTMLNSPLRPETKQWFDAPTFQHSAHFAISHRKAATGTFRNCPAVLPVPVLWGVPSWNPWLWIPASRLPVHKPRNKIRNRRACFQDLRAKLGVLQDQISQDN